MPRAFTVKASSAHDLSAAMTNFFRRITTRIRSAEADRQLAFFLSFVAGAANAGGFMAIQQYTSHMSGVISAMADNVVLGEFGLVVAGVGALGSFIAGAATSAILVNWGRRMRLHSEFAFPLLLEALLLMAFGLFGAFLQTRTWLFVPLTVVLLCFIMGLQNAIITKLSQSRIRTTHMTGIVTDIGIELGKLAYVNVSDGADKVYADRDKLRLLANLCGLFFCGGVVGAYGFKQMSFSFSLVLSAMVLSIAVIPVLDDVKSVLAKKPTD